MQPAGTTWAGQQLQSRCPPSRSTTSPNRFMTPSAASPRST